MRSAAAVLILVACTANPSTDSETASVTQKVDKKVEVCHRIDGAPVTITISERAISAHLAHGDTLGACPMGCTPGSCDDGDLCTSDGCDADGACTHELVACDDGNPCTAERCDPAAGCIGTPADGVACDDGNDCTATDTCSAGRCAGAPVAGCCTTDAACDDGNACTIDRCVGHACTNAAVDCTQADRCQAGYCDPATGVCGSAPVSCDDGNPCTRDACDSSVGCTAVTLPNGSDCDDGAICTIGDHCDGSLCVAGSGVCTGGVGAVCSTDGDCDVGLVCPNGTCKLALGASCVASLQCASQVCRYFSPTLNICADNACYAGTLEPDGRCTHVLNGGTCAADDRCVSGICAARSAIVPFDYGGDLTTCSHTLDVSPFTPQYFYPVNYLPSDGPIDFVTLRIWGEQGAATLVTLQATLDGTTTSTASSVSGSCCAGDCPLVTFPAGPVPDTFERFGGSTFQLAALGGVFTVDRAELELGFHQCAAPPLQPYVEPSYQYAGEFVTIVDPQGRITPDMIVDFYETGSDPAIGLQAHDVTISADGTTLVCRVPYMPGGLHFISIRPTMDSLSIFGDIPFFPKL